MYNFQKSRQTILQDAKNYGVTIKLIDNGSFHGVLEFASERRGSQSVEKFLERKMATYNKHAKQGH